MRLEGVYAPIPTSFDAGDTESLCLNSLRRNMLMWKETSLSGLVLCGSNGELPFTDIEERVLLTQTAKTILEGSPIPKKIVVCTFMHTTRATITCCKAVADVGADAALLLPPHYFKEQGMPGVINFFMTVAEDSPIPIILYNMPGNTGVNMDVDTILRLSKHPNIIGIKDTAGDMTQLGYLAAAADENFSVFCGSGNYLLPALSVGASGGTLAVANLYPESCAKLIDAYKSGRMKEAKDLQQRILLISDAITRKFGIPGLKAAMEKLGMYGGPCRSPLMPLDETSKQKIFDIIERADLDLFETWRKNALHPGGL